jgi:hypothetical protein
MMPNLSIEEMLAQRDSVYMEWMEPRQACNQLGCDVSAHIINLVTVSDCINLSRETHRRHGNQIAFSDRDLLLDWIAIHFAVPFDADELQRRPNKVP